ncbi:MAG: hypothetical protein OEY61_14290 [Gammaproteobacteria bacterium]|nr:hypothetical protein [Gammaproteobacteria bacterium]
MTRSCLTIILLTLSHYIHATTEVPGPSVILDNASCIQCHEQLNQPLIDDWLASSHAASNPVTDCVSCHGPLHNAIASHARRNDTCIHCHGGSKGPVSHSYLNSKHGILMQLETGDYNWNQKLENANYRAPSCAYCHMHAGNHQLRLQQTIQNACHDCHAPRYLSRQHLNGQEMYRIATLKIEEAETLIRQARPHYSRDELATTDNLLKQMQQHLRHVKLGIGHLSPDYQWWHGQPALDGDLLRIKGSIGELKREKEIGKIQSAESVNDTHSKTTRDHP